MNNSKHTPEQCQKIRDAWVRRLAAGYKVSDSTKAKMSAAKKGRTFSLQHRQALSEAQLLRREHERNVRANVLR